MDGLAQFPQFPLPPSLLGARDSDRASSSVPQKIALSKAHVNALQWRAPGKEYSLWAMAWLFEPGFPSNYAEPLPIMA